jgi:hypothetical protein
MRDAWVPRGALCFVLAHDCDMGSNGVEGGAKEFAGGACWLVDDGAMGLARARTTRGGSDGVHEESRIAKTDER